jgi:photosystem II stability/assembly factor-like uncharacterized protein
MLKISTYICLLLFFFSSISICQWTQTNGPHEGSISCMSFNGTKLFAGTFSEGVYFSTDYGGNWTQVNNGMTNLSINTIHSKSENIFVGTYDGIFLSMDNGNSWSPQNNGLTSMEVRSLTSEGNKLFAGTWGGGVFVSTDDGLSWNGVNSGLENQNINTLFITGSYFFAGTNTGLYFSTNNGINWNFRGLSNIQIRSLVINGTNLFAGTNSGVYLSTNNGSNWIPINNGLLTHSIYQLAVYDSSIFAGTYNRGVFKTSNNGIEWIRVSDGLINQSSYAFASLDSILFTGTVGGIYATIDNGINWTMRSNGLPYPFINTIVSIEDNIFVGTTASGIHLSTNSGKSWKQSSYGLSRWDIKTIIKKDSILFAGTDEYIFNSTNNAESWNRLEKYFPGSANKLIVYNSDLLVTSGSYVYLSSDNGLTWSSISNGIYTNYTINDIATIDTNIFVGTRDKGLLFTSDRGQNWIPRNNGLTSFNINSLFFLDSILFASISGIVYKSTDYGLNWILANSGLLGHAIRRFDYSGQKIFAIGDGVFLSENEGEMWEDKSDGLPNRAIMSICINDSFIFVSPFKEAIWRIPLSEMVTSVIQPTDLGPKIFDLSQNYPNPFNPSTTISYQLPETGNVNIKVYDVLGKEVATLVNNEQRAGSYKVDFNGSSLASGIYYYQIRAGKFVETKKMILLK